MKTTNEMILANVDRAREAAVATLEAAKVTLRVYRQQVEYAQAHTSEASQDMADASREAQEGLDNVYDALEAVKRYTEPTSV